MSKNLHTTLFQNIKCQVNAPPAKAEFAQIDPVENTMGFTDDSQTEGEVAGESEIVICPKQ